MLGISPNRLGRGWVTHLSGTETIRLIMKSGGRSTPAGVPVAERYPTIGKPVGDPVRGPFCIARRSRHEVPKTPGHLRYAIYIYDPDRVSVSIGARHYERRPGGVVGRALLGDPQGGSRGVGTGLSTFETNVREWHFVQHSLMRYLYWSLGEGKGRKLFSL